MKKSVSKYNSGLPTDFTDRTTDENLLMDLIN